MALPPGIRDREELARRVLARADSRANLDDYVGIQQSAEGGAAEDIRKDLYAEYGRTGQHAEAERVVAMVNLAADEQADPDWD
ncbi:hypothetical protein [Amycolatopsis marina]|nr:hypothetical protein [Amycolatopsis marina]